MFNADFNSWLTPQSIINFLKNNSDFKKIGMNVLNSEEGKSFIQNDLGYNYEDFKGNLTNLFLNTKKSQNGLKKQQEVQEGKKLQNYKQLANSLVQKHGLSLHSAIILAAGFVGIDKKKVSDFLKNKGYSASVQFVEKYYNKNEDFLKSILKSDGVIVKGWNDAIQSSDLEIEASKKDQRLIQVPDDDLKNEFKK